MNAEAARLARAPAEAPAPLWWVCAAFAGGVLLHIDRMPPWATASALILILWRIFNARSPWYPGLAARAGLALTLVAIVLLRFHTLNGLAAGTTLLMLMAALKLLETRRARDQLVLLAAALFLLVAACLDRQDLVRAPLYALEAWLCCAALAVVAYPGFTPGAALRLAGRALLLALPLALLLFVFFPRLPGAFWAIPRGELAVTGLSDTMNPFGIGQLASSYDPAFRAWFSGAPPPPEERYWRGPVLHEFDGYSWRRGYGLFHASPPLQFVGSAYRYRLVLEPTYRHFWFALDTPVQSPDPRVLLTFDRQLFATEPVDVPVSYLGVSYTHLRSNAPLPPDQRRTDSALPAGGNPRTRALAQQLRAQAPSDAAYVEAVLGFLRNGGFVYSLEPEVLGADPVDQFLFRTRTGFCGHYASAFVVLMRAAGVPARVVTGYLGGEWNPAGYLLVRQSEAHAWAEVWLPSGGWTRVDPTAVVAPERLRYGVIDLMPDSLPARARLLHASPWLAALLQRWDAANALWSERVVKFDYGSQLNLLARLGIHTPSARLLGWAFMAALCVWLVAVGWYFSRGARPARADALARAYARLCRKLAHAALPRAAHQGPCSYAAELSAGHPQLAARVQPLLELYAQLRYGPPTPATQARDIADFARRVARLRLPRAVTRSSGVATVRRT
jgi:protein-glutamine gamma-glutamyltransferase